MTTAEVAKKLFDLCQSGDFLKAVEDTYSQDIVSVEPMAMNGAAAEAHGFEAVKGKSLWWMENHEIHKCEVSGPYVHGDKFMVGFNLDVTNKPSKKRMQMKEIGLYFVMNGKVVREEFFYSI